jgi:hypothetical protein
MDWSELERGAPELAELARSEFARAGMALVGTLTRDGSPRISCVDPQIIDGALFLGMMWRSRKAADLRRDPRLVLRNAVCTNRGDEVEVILRGEAVEVTDEEARRRYLGAVPEWGERPFHLYAVDVQTAAVIRYTEGEQYVSVWPSGTERRRRY